MLPLSEQERTSYLDRFGPIAALGTAVGGPIAVVRVTGKEACRILESLTKSKLPESRKMSLRMLYGIAGQALDQALVCWFASNASFTGEESFELHVHGSRWIVEAVLESLYGLGAVPALPGEFSFRAVRNGKMSLYQAQAVKDLIEAGSDRARELALEKLSGKQNEWITAISEKLKQLTALGELGIDFSDQDLDELSLVRLKAGAAEILQVLRRLADSFVRGRRIQEGLSVAFVGLPNAGKSSLFNALLGEERSIVSELPGTTRDVVREGIRLRDEQGRAVVFRVSDTAGIRRSTDRLEQMGIERTLEAASRSDLVIWVVAVGTPASEVRQLAEYSQKLRDGRKHILVVTQSDRDATVDLSALQHEIAREGDSGVIRTSALTGVGIEALSRKMTEATADWLRPNEEEIILTQKSHQEAVERACKDLERALAADELDLFSSDLREALMHLEPLIGQTPSDEILRMIFSQFCIGK